MDHALMENGNGLLMDFLVSRATGVAEHEAVPVMLDDARRRGYRPKTLGGDKGHDTRECVRAMRNRGVTPHVAQRTHSAIDGRITRHPSYRASQKVRKRVEEVFGWMKTVGGFRRTRYRGVERTGLAGYFVATAALFQNCHFVRGGLGVHGSSGGLTVVRYIAKTGGLRWHRPGWPWKTAMDEVATPSGPMYCIASSMLPMVM